MTGANKFIPMFKLTMLAMAFILVGLTPAKAQQAGCSPEFREVQENHAQAQVVKDVSMANEIIKRPDSVLALSCFDQAMAASAKAGHIFSDREPTFIPPTWDLMDMVTAGIGSALEGPFGAGTTSTLAEQINNVVEPATNELLSIFGDSLSGAIGGVLTSAYNSIIGPFMNVPVLGDLMGSLLGISMDCTTGNDVLELVLGQGIDKGVDYPSFDDFVNQVLDWGTAGATQAAANADILGNASDDLFNIGTPGYFPSNPITPVIPLNATVEAIIGNM